MVLLHFLQESPHLRRLCRILQSDLEVSKYMHSASLVWLHSQSLVKTIPLRHQLDIWQYLLQVARYVLTVFRELLHNLSGQVTPIHRYHRQLSIRQSSLKVSRFMHSVFLAVLRS